MKLSEKTPVLLIPACLRRILTETPQLWRTYCVGGCVRDWLLGLPCKDLDLEVFGVSYQDLVQALKPWGKTDLVGRSFGVVKLTIHGGETFDFTIPRRDSKVAPGHKGFEIEFDPDITPQQAASRRDFTINALMYDPVHDEMLDFFGGLNDLRNRILRHTSSAFAEDPLRVLRGMQFAGRFGLTACAKTRELCRSIASAYTELAVERVREEWFKWAEKSILPSAGLRFLEHTGWIRHFPEIQALQGVPQDPEWHPEGDVFTHTCHGCDALQRLPEWRAADAETRIVLMLAVLGHDFAKPQTTTFAEKGGRMRWISPGHEEGGGPLVERFLERINAPLAIRKRVLPLVVQHLAHLQQTSEKAVRRLAKRLEPETIENLCLVMIADGSGRPPLPAEVPPGVTTLREIARAMQLNAAAPKPILQGRHLMEMGIAPGPAMGEILAGAFEAQLEGCFNNLEGARQWAGMRLGSPSSGT